MKIRIEILVEAGREEQSMEEAIRAIFNELGAPILGILARIEAEPEEEQLHA
jgi:hypothetical protein